VDGAHVSRGVHGRRRACAALILALAGVRPAIAQAPPRPEQAPPEAPPAEPGRSPKAGGAPFDRAQLKQMEVLHRPAPDEISPLYPAAALEGGRTGKVVVECRIRASTLLDRCKVLSEDPTGYGFGGMGIKVAGLFRIRPPTYRGEVVEDATAKIPMTFNVTPPPPVKTLEDREQARAAGALPAETPAETPAQRLKRLGPLVRSPDVLWAPQGFAIAVALALAWALFWPMRRRARGGL
jgi:hypothetical protein